MRNTIYIKDRAPMFAGVAAIAQPGTLIVVEDEETANKMRRLITVVGGQTFWHLTHDDPTVHAGLARQSSVEVRTLAEMEQDESNEKIAMEV